jgi:hypothetical protein
VKRTVAPSITDWNVTPSSSICVTSREAEHLVAAGVGQDRPVPAHHAVQAAERAHGLLARAQVQVVRVREQHAAPSSRSSRGGRP